MLHPEKVNYWKLFNLILIFLEVTWEWDRLCFTKSWCEQSNLKKYKNMHWVRKWPCPNLIILVYHSEIYLLREINVIWFLLTLTWVDFLGVCFEVERSGKITPPPPPLPPSLKLVTIILGTSNLACTYVVSENIPFSTKIFLILTFWQK